MRSVGMRKRSVHSNTKEGGVPCHEAPMETKVFSDLSNCVAHLAVTRYEDGSPRRPGRLLIATRGSSYEVIAKEPDGQLELTVVASTLDDALALMDLFLGAEEAPWRPDPWAASRPQPRGKKRD
jgi:hypothetical protein